MDVTYEWSLVDVPRHHRGPEERGEHAEVDQDGGHLARNTVRDHFDIVGREEDDLNKLIIEGGNHW